MEGYGQFCPVAMTAELLTRRWTPLVIRELLQGSRRFNEIRRGVPRMSPSLLSKRLRELEKGGVLVRRTFDDGERVEYHLTRAGEELGPSSCKWEPGAAGGRRARSPAGTPKGQRDFWLVLHGGEVDLCLVDPGHDVDLWVEADLLTMTKVWLGDVRFLEAARCGASQLTGPSRFRRAFPGWLGLDSSARTKRVAAR